MSPPVKALSPGKDFVGFRRGKDGREVHGFHLHWPVRQCGYLGKLPLTERGDCDEAIQSIVK